MKSLYNNPLIVFIAFINLAPIQMQTSDFEEHLRLYENALQLGAGGYRSRHVRRDGMSDSIGELVGGQDLARKLDWQTPPPQKVYFQLLVEVISILHWCNWP